MYHISFPQRSNRASWVFIGLITDLNDNPIDLTGCSMLFEVRERVDPYLGGVWGCGSYGRCVLEASTDNGKITFIQLGTFRWYFSPTDMRTLRPGTYDTGLTLTSADGSQVAQLSIGPLPIVDGVVP